MNRPSDLPLLLIEIFNKQPDPIFIKDHHHRYLYVNEAFAKFFRQSATGYFIDKDDFALMDEAQAQVCRENDAVVLKLQSHETVRTHSSDELAVTSQGQRSLTINRFGLRDPQGTVFLFGVIRDLTDQKAREAQQVNTERRLRDLLEMMDEVMWALEWGTLQTVFMSPTAGRFYGVETESILSPSDWVRAYSQSEINRMMNLILACEASGKDQFYGEFKFKHPTRGDRVAFIRGKVIRDSNGEPIQVEGMTSDITDSKITEEKIEEQRHMLNALSKLQTLGELASGIGHEINTPLSGILSKIARVQFILQPDQPITNDVLLKSSRLLKESMDLVERIAQIIDGLKQLSQNESAETLEAFDPLSTVEQALSLSRARFSNHGIRIQILNSVPQGRRVLCHQTSLFQALVNLLNNAFDALEGLGEGAHVRVELEQAGNQVLIRVIDNGRGVPQEVKPRLFGAFVTSKVEGKGTGLGLNLSRKLLRTHGADLDFLERTDGLTAFQITLALSP